MGGSSSSTTEQSQTSYPQWTQDAQQNTWQTGTGMMENFLRNPQYAVAGYTTDQKKAMDLIRDTARKAYTADQITVPGSPNLTAALGTAAMGTAAQVTPDAIKAFMNPFLDTVGNTTLDNMRREYLNADAGLSSKYAAAGALGGSGEALARGQAARGYNQNVSSTIAQLQAAGYDKATAVALANAQMQQQMELANTANRQQSGLANMAAENAMRTTGADYGLKGAQISDALLTNQQAREMGILQKLLESGTFQQQFGQRVADVPWTMLERLLAMTPKQVNSQTYGQKETESEQSPLGTILGVGTSLFGGGSGGILGGVKSFLGGK